MDPPPAAGGLIADPPHASAARLLQGAFSASEVFEFALGVGLVAGLFWCLFHLESDWPERLVRDRAFRHDAAAILFAIVMAFFLSNFLL